MPEFLLVGKRKMNKINLFIQDYFVSSRTPDVTNFFNIITSFFDFSLLFLLLVVVVSIFIIKLKKVGSLYLFLGSLLSSMTVVYFLKYFFNTERPTDSVVNTFGASFPSYHATISTVFFTTIYYIFKDQLQGHTKNIFGIFSFLMIFLVALSRVYLGAHWISDVFFGVILGLVITHVSIHFYRIYNKNL